MAKFKLIPWLGLGYFVSVQAICFYVILGFVSQATKRYEDLAAISNDWSIPRSIQVFLDTQHFLRNRWYFWIPVLAGALFWSGWMVWKYRDKNWSGLVLGVIGTAQLGLAVSMVVVTYQHLSSLM